MTGDEAREAFEPYRKLARALATSGYRGPVLVQDATVQGGEWFKFRVEG